MPPNIKKIKEEEGGSLRINKGIKLMLQPRRNDAQEQLDKTNIRWENKMSNVTLVLSTLISVLFLMVGGIIGWLYQQHIQQTTIPLLHPEMFDEHGNVVTDEVISFRFENADLMYGEEELEDD